MSAYICDKVDFAYIASVFYKVEDCQLGKEHAVAFAQMLYEENVKSVNYRYKEDTVPVAGLLSEDDIIDVDVYGDEFRLAANCLDYQSCEHNGWESSKAKCELDRLERQIDSPSRFPLRGDADNWGAPDWFVEMYLDS